MVLRVASSRVAWLANGAEEGFCNYLMRHDSEKWRVRTGEFARKWFFGGMMLLVATLGLREAMVSLARELRAVADAVAPGIGMGLCATYTLYDIEGTDAAELVSAFAGDGPKLLRLSGLAPHAYAAVRFQNRKGVLP